MGTTSTKEVEFEKIKAHVFLNATSGFFSLSLYNYLPEHAIVYIYNTNGTLVYDKCVMHGINQIDIGHLSAATFVYKIIDNGEVLDVGKIVKI